jgi:hypothetical protein
MESLFLTEANSTEISQYLKSINENVPEYPK